MRRYWIFFGFLFFAALSASVAIIAQARNESVQAQSAEMRDAKRERRTDSSLDLNDAEIREIVDIAQLYTLEKELGLSEDQLMRVLPKWRQLVEKRSQFWGERRTRREQLESALVGARGDDARLRQALSAFRSEEDEFWSVHRKIEDEILAELTIEQQVRYKLIDSEQGRRTSRLIRALRALSRNDESPPAGFPEPPSRPVTEQASR